MKKIKKILILLVVSMLLFACGDSENKNKKLSAMIVAIPQGDPFIKSAYKGLEQLGLDNGIETKIIEALDKSEYNEQIRAMSEMGASPIYVLWDDLAMEVINVAPEFPDTHYIIVDAYVESDLPNVKTINVEPQEASFIAGYVAAKTTETKKLAWIGSMETATVKRFKSGFESGAKYADDTVNIESIYIGSAEDPNKGTELAKQLIASGVDVIMHSANQSGLGVIRAGEEMNVKIIGVDEWQGAINEDIVFWSALKDITSATYSAGESSIKGNFVPGMEIYNAATGVKLYDERDFDKLPDELKKEVEDIKAKIISGEITIDVE